MSAVPELHRLADRFRLLDEVATERRDPRLQLVDFCLQRARAIRLRPRPVVLIINAPQTCLELLGQRILPGRHGGNELALLAHPSGEYLPVVMCLRCPVSGGFSPRSGVLIAEHPGGDQPREVASGSRHAEDDPIPDRERWQEEETRSGEQGAGNHRPSTV